MHTRLLHHIRSNVVAYLALFVALGGTSYAFKNLPANSVGARQLRNHAITPVKLDPKSIAGSIRARVDLEWRGSQLVAASSNSPVNVTTLANGELIHWSRMRFASACIVVATPHANLPPRPSGIGLNTGYVNPQFTPPRDVFLAGFAPDGTGRPQAASLVVVCP